jgi:hypothetical protein
MDWAAILLFYQLERVATRNAVHHWGIKKCVLHIHHFQSLPLSFRLWNMYIADWGCEQRCSLLKVSKWVVHSYLPKICACKNIVFSLIPRTLGVLMCTLIAYCQTLQDLTHVTLRYPYWQLLIFYKSLCKPCNMRFAKSYQFACTLCRIRVGTHGYSSLQLTCLAATDKKLNGDHPLEGHNSTLPSAEHKVS